MDNDFELVEGMAISVLDTNADTFEAVIVSLNDDDSVTVRSEMTGKQYTVDKKYILPANKTKEESTKNEEKIELEYYRKQDDKIKEFIKQLKEEERIFWCHGKTLSEDFMNTIAYFKRCYGDVLGAYAAFVEHTLNSLRALQMIAKSGYSMTHRQRDARLDVLCDTIEEAVKQIINEKNNGLDCYMDAPFTRKDWDTRRLVAENYKLRREIEGFKKEITKKENANELNTNQA